MGRTALAVAAVVVGVGSWAACGGQYESSEAGRGRADQLCFENGTCFEDLVCFAGRCVSKEYFEGGVPQTSTSTSASSTSSSASSSSSSGSSTSSSGDAGGSSTSGSSRDPTCDNNKKCSPNTYAAEFRDDAACVVAYKSLPGSVLQGIDPKCAPSAVCGESTAECFKGTLANDKKCITGSQCTSGHCKGFTGTACGTCQNAKAKGAPCSATDITCAAGQRCDFTGSPTKCVDALTEGANCDGAAAGNCTTGLVCASFNKKCTKPSQIDGPCELYPGATFSLDCRSGLTCKDKKCADIAPTFLEADQSCDPTKYATERCRTGYACDPAVKKCLKPIASPGLDCTN